MIPAGNGPVPQRAQAGALLAASFGAYWALLIALFVALDVGQLRGWPVWLLGGLWMLSALHLMVCTGTAARAAGWRLPWAWGVATLVFTPLLPLALPPTLWWVLSRRDGRW